MLANDPAADLLDEAAARIGELTEQLDVARVVGARYGAWCASCRRGHVR
jgi:hypothetical protein